MPGLTWSLEEIVTVLYFSSRRLPTNLIEKIMRIRQFPSTRSETGIRDKLKALKKTLPHLLNQNKEWDQSAVDAWIASCQLQRPVQELLMYGSREKDETFAVGALPPTWS
jgi:hypothetical protein